MKNGGAARAAVGWGWGAAGNSAPNGAFGGLGKKGRESRRSGFPGLKLFLIR